MEVLNDIGQALLNFVIDWWPILGPALYEVIARKIPTAKNYSLFDNLWKVLDFFFKNKRLPQPQDVMVNETQNTVVVDIDKHILK